MTRGHYMLIGLILPIALGGWLLAGDTPAKSAAPASDIIFPHDPHVADQGLACQTCHAAADSSHSAADKLYPTMDVCGDCHDIEDAKGCGQCHRNPDDPSASPNPERSILFNHQVHVKKGTDCARCHDGVGQSTQPGPDDMPTMNVCLDCHDRTVADKACKVCHGDRITLSDIHPIGWRHAHAERAATDNTWCRGCHRQERFCLDCHRGDNTLGNIHELNYAFTHGLDAGSKEIDCARCHDRKTFCVGCHEGENRMPLLHSTAGWLANHGRAAQDDVENCASCHEADSPTCARAGCHRDSDGVRGTDPRIHGSTAAILESHGPWHNDDGYYCYQCHTSTHQAGVGFCGYCHDSGD